MKHETLTCTSTREWSHLGTRVNPRVLVPGSIGSAYHLSKRRRCLYIFGFIRRPTSHERVDSASTYTSTGGDCKFPTNANIWGSLYVGFSNVSHMLDRLFIRERFHGIVMRLAEEYRKPCNDQSESHSSAVAPANLLSTSLQEQASPQEQTANSLDPQTLQDPLTKSASCEHQKVRSTDAEY